MSLAILAAAALGGSAGPAAPDVHARTREVAICVAEKRPEVADGIIRVPRGAPDESRLLDAIRLDDTISRCFGNDREAVDLTTLRGVVAETLYRREFPKALDASMISGIEPIIQQAQDTETKLRYWFAHCVVRSAPVVADNFVRSEPGSPEERAAVAELAPALPACLPKNMTAKFSRRELRAYSAEALYRVAATVRRRDACKGIAFDDAVRQELTCPATPLGKGMQIGIHDYPKASFNAEEHGTVSIQYSIGSNGSIEPGTCVVVISSGHDRLDRGTCQLAEQRFKFRPSLLRGKPVPEVRNHTVRWTLPR